MQANLLQAVERYLQNNSLIGFAYLFGSYAKGGA
jgi:predicted nucleotidyltransferase